jgi:hypothetical protein
VSFSTSAANGPKNKFDIFWKYCRSKLSQNYSLIIYFLLIRNWKGLHLIIWTRLKKVLCLFTCRHDLRNWRSCKWNRCRFERSEYDKGRFWPNLRNCLYRYNIKYNHWKVRTIFLFMISLCPLLLRRVQLIIRNSNMMVLFYIYLA